MLANQRPMIDGLLGGITERLIDDESRAILSVLGSSPIHRKGHIENLRRLRAESNMKRQAFASPSFHVARKETRDEVVMVLEATSPILIGSSV